MTGNELPLESHLGTPASGQATFCRQRFPDPLVHQGHDTSMTTSVISTRSDADIRFQFT